MTSKYSSFKQIAGGNFGEVWEAIGNESNEKVAIKILDLKKNYPDKYKRIYREIFVLNFLKSNYSISLTDIYERKENNIHQICLVLPYMQFELRNILEKYTLNFNQNIQIIYQILLALQYLSSCGILHRDLKPANIGVNTDMRLRLLDYGLARDSKIAMTDYVVSRWYRSLDALISTNYTASVDMWSAGCILVELLTQSVLFKGSGATDQVVKIVSIMGMPEKVMLDEMDENGRLAFNLFIGKAAETNILEKHIADKAKKYLDNQDQDVNFVFSELMLLIQRMLELNPVKRISPDSALKATIFESHRSMLAQYEPDTPPPRPCEFCIAFEDANDDGMIFDLIQETIRTFNCAN